MLHNLIWHVVPLLQSPRCVPADCWPGVRSRLRVTEVWTSPTSRLPGGTAWPSVLSYTTRGLTSCKNTGNTCGCWQLFRPRCFFFFFFYISVWRVTFSSLWTEQLSCKNEKNGFHLPIELVFNTCWRPTFKLHVIFPWESIQVFLVVINLIQKQAVMHLESTLTHLVQSAHTQLTNQIKVSESSTGVTSSHFVDSNSHHPRHSSQLWFHI